MGDVLTPELYTGVLCVNDVEYPIDCSIGAGEDCRLCFEQASVPKEVYVAVAKDSARPGEEERELKFSGQSSSGKVVTSDAIVSVGHKHNDSGFHIQLEARSATVAVKLAAPLDTPVIDMRFRGFQAFPSVHKKTPLGELHVGGAARVGSQDEVSGGVTLRSSNALPPDQWRGQAEAFLDHRRFGLMLAHGGRLQTPLVRFGRGDMEEATFYAGSAFARELPVHHHLNLEPIVSALVERYFAHGPLPPILWTALGWTQVDTTIDEVRFLTAMTALEAIISSELKATSGFVPKERFKPLLKQFRTAVDQSDLDEARRDKMKEKLGNLNSRSFAESLAQLFVHYQIAEVDYGAGVLSWLVKIRNRIVHDGVATNESDLWQGIILARELVARIILASIGFKGTYNCYIGGGHMRSFPVCVPAG